MDDKQTKHEIKLTLHVSRFENDEGTQGVEYKMMCRIDEGDDKALFILEADASMLDFHDLYEEHLAKLAESIVQRNLNNIHEKQIKEQAAQERVRIDTEALH